jgi:uncharacterized membrane protein (DUF373 family)
MSGGVDAAPRGHDHRVPSPRTTPETTTETPDPPLAVRAGNRLLSAVEDVIYVGIAILLAGSALVVLFRAGEQLLDKAQESKPDAMLEVLDSLLLVFILVELLYAVRTTLKERQIVAEPFLIAGVLVAIKEIVVLAVKGAGDYLSKGPEFARAMTEIGVLTAVIAVLATATLVLRRKEEEPPETATAPAPD